jgi:hypothetical protein
MPSEGFNQEEGERDRSQSPSLQAARAQTAEVNACLKEFEKQRKSRWL